MTILRATKKVLRYVPPRGDERDVAETALGDWYVNRLIIDRRPLALLLNARSLLTILLPARDLRSLPDRLPAIVGARLHRLGVRSSLIDAETAAMAPVVVAPTNDRHVLGYLNDFGQVLPYALSIDEWDETSLPFVEIKLARTPCHLGDQSTLFPEDRAPELLAARWPAPL